MLSMCKYYASEVAVKASGLAVQLLGADPLHGGTPDRGCSTATRVNSRSSRAPARSSSGLIARGVLGHGLVGLSCSVVEQATYTRQR